MVPFTTGRALATSFPNAVLVCFGRCATVRFRVAALAAFLIFRRAAARCFDVVTTFTPIARRVDVRAAGGTQP